MNKFALVAASALLFVPGTASATHINFNNFMSSTTGDVVQTPSRYTITASGNNGTGYFGGMLAPGQYNFSWVSNKNLYENARLTYWQYDNADHSNNQVWLENGSQGLVTLNSIGISFFSFTYEFQNGQTFSFTDATGAPEIDGGKLPLAALLLGLVAVIAQRKRKALLAA